METCKVVLTFESADEILRCDNSIETFSAISFHGTLCSFLFLFFFWKLYWNLTLVTIGIEMVLTLTTSSSDAVLQGCALRKTEGSPVLWACEIRDAQHMICVKNARFSSCPRAKVRHQGPLGSARAQPCIVSGQRGQKTHPVQQLVPFLAPLSADTFITLTLVTCRCFSR